MPASGELPPIAGRSAHRITPCIADSVHQQKIKFLRELRELAKLTGALGVKYNFDLP